MASPRDSRAPLPEARAEVPASPETAERSDTFPLEPLGVPSLPVLERLRSRGSLPTLDVASGPPIVSVTHEGDGNLLALLSANARTVTAEHTGRYAAHPNGELGRGGMGRVFVALDRHLGRDVAIKELLLASEGEIDRTRRLQTLARFLREARITGELEHPNIVPVYELGRRADGTLYYSMRVVRGRTLGRALAEAGSLPERLALLDHFVGLCQAIAYAHSRGVVHRDIKPDNVMIGEFGETIVLDWGMAKARGRDAQAESTGQPTSLALDVTLDGSLCGTPTHMSPEQATGAHESVDERSDVWALGVVLYTILAGRTPFAGQTLNQIVERIRSASYTPLRQVDPRIPRELAAVAERALSLEPARRYAGGRELLDDVNAYRAGLRVDAYRYSPLEIVARFLGRHRVAAVASMVGLSVALGLAVASDLLLARARDRALLAEQRATHNAEDARRSEHAARQNLSEVLVDKAQQAMQSRDLSGAELLAAEAVRLVERPDARGLLIAAQSTFRPEPLREPARARGCARAWLRPGGGSLACARGNQLEIYTLTSAAEPRRLVTGAGVQALAYSSDGSHFAYATDDGKIRLVSTAKLDAEPLFVARADRVESLAVAPDGASVACGGSRGGVLVWATPNPSTPRRLTTTQAVSVLAFTPDARRLVVGGELGQLELWDFRSGEIRSSAGHAGTVRALAFAQDGHYLASAGADRTLRFWNLEDGSVAQAPIVASDAITALDWSADARLVAYATKDNALAIVDLHDPTRGAELRFLADPVDSLAFSADGGALSSVTRDLGLERWSLASLKTPWLLPERGNVLAFGFVPGRNELASAGLGADGVALWNLATGSVETRLPSGVERVRTLDVSPDGQRLAFAGSGTRVFLWDLPSRLPLSVFEDSRDEVRSVAFSRDGQLLAYAGLDRVLRVVETRSFNKRAEIAGASAFQALAFGEGRRLWSGDRDGALTAWDLDTQRPRLRLQAHGDWLLGVAVSRDGRRVASAGADRHVKLWDAQSGGLLWDFAGHDGKVLSVAFSSDGALVASGAEDKSVRILDAEHGRELATLRGHSGAVRAVRFSADRPLLVSASDDGTLRLWHLDGLSELGARLRRETEQRYRVRLLGTRVERTAPE